MNLVCSLLQLYFFALLARIVLSWFPINEGSPFASIFGFLYTITEPVLGPVRRIMPPMGVGGMGLDLSPIVVFFGLQLVTGAIC